MFQRIDLSKKWDSNFWSYSRAVVSARMSSRVHIELRGITINNSISAWQTLSKSQYTSTDFIVSSVYRLERRERRFDLAQGYVSA